MRSTTKIFPIGKYTVWLGCLLIPTASLGRLVYWQQPCDLFLVFGLESRLKKQPFSERYKHCFNYRDHNSNVVKTDAKTKKRKRDFDIRHQILGGKITKLLKHPSSKVPRFFLSSLQLSYLFGQCRHNLL